MKVLEFPLAKITICFIFGLLIGHYFMPNFFISSTILLISFLFLIVVYVFSKKHKTIRLLYGVFTLSTIVFIGIFTTVIHNQKLNPKHYLNQLTKSNDLYQIELVIKEQLKNTYNNDRYIAQVLKLDSKDSYGRVILNINRDSLIQKAIVGSHCLIYGSVYKNRNPNNPNQFDYGKYLEHQQIYAQIYCNYEAIKTSSVYDKDLNYYAAKIRTKIISNLEKNHFNKDDLSVLSALLLGQRQEISQEIIRNYQYAGAIHILSVSGLHVGLILLFITFLLKPIPNTKRGVFIKLIITIISLWLFGIIAGLAPSIVRSVTMFSFVAVGMYLKRSVNIYHTLLVSILLILLFKPSFLFEVGFQLSYIALFFIVWLQPVLKSIWSPKIKIISYFWDILTVSFAAQIGTLPLSLYYFHQFPGLFFITNLAILPMLSIILGLGVFVIVLALFNYVPLYPMKTLEFSIGLLNKIIAWVASFESFIFKEISLNIQLMICAYLILIFTTIWLIKPNFKKFAFALLAVIAFQSFHLYAKYNSKNADEFIVFNRKGYTLITERIDNKVNVYSNDSILKNHNDNLVLKSYIVANFCEIDKLKLTQNLYEFKSKKIELIDSSGVYLENINPDVLLLSNSPKINFERALETIHPKLVVFDASNYKNLRKNWKQTCIKEKILFHDTTEKGFFKLY